MEGKISVCLELKSFLIPQSANQPAVDHCQGMGQLTEV